MARHRFELAKAGVWGRDGSLITKKDIAEVVETFGGKRPAIIGHIEGQRSPKFGDVENLYASSDGETLIGDVMLLEAAESLYGDGYYNGWSVAIPRRITDGKRYFHHLAFLGATPPKIPALAELPLEAVSYGEKESAESYSFGGKLQEVHYMDDLEKAKQEAKKLAEEKAALEKGLADLEKAKEEAKKLAEEKAALEKELADLKKAAGGKKGGEFSDTAAGAGGNDKAKGEYADLQKEIADLKAAEKETRLASFSDAVLAKLPEGVREKAKRLAQSVEGVRRFEFADGKKEDALTLLKDVLSLWPSPIMASVVGEFSDGGGQGGKTVDWGAVASKM